ncbi:MAG TPA: ATP-binding protein [Terracidiphilus sp.]|nr:ATP-binding protein [Terracidiphilus sp.]
MSENSAQSIPEKLTLRSRLEDLACVFPWVESLAAAYAIPAGKLFAMNLCLEEVLSNIVRHGYRCDPDQTMTVEFARNGDREFSFIVEDSAPHFRPFDPAVPLEDVAPAALEDIVPGGNGIRLLRKFADSVKWEPLEPGNRLTIGFVVPEST